MVKVIHADENPTLVQDLQLSEIQLIRLTSPGDWLDSGYCLFESVFDDNVLDDKQAYIDRLSPQAMSERDLVFCLSCAVVNRNGQPIVLGIIGADLMWIGDSGNDAVLAIGNIAVAECVRNRRIGIALYEFTVNLAKQEAEKDGRQLLCIVLESEERSLGFWRYMRFLKPDGVKYFQPPLEWNDNGSPVHLEVEETLLISPTELMNAGPISPALLVSVVSAMYENWSLRGYRGKLNENAMKNAETYISNLLEDVRSTILLASLELKSPELDAETKQGGDK